MFTTIFNADEITELQKRLEQAFRSQKPEIIRAIVGSPGGAFETNFLYIGEHEFWVVFGKDKNRYWNAFGVGRPTAGKNTSITCEINFPYGGVDRKIAGVFAKEGDRVILLHRGKIGGGRKGIGKNLFLDNYRGSYLSIQDGDTENTLALIGSLDSKYFVQQVANFVYEIERIKDLINSMPEQEAVDVEEEENENYPFDFDFKEEGYGKRRYTRKDKIEADSNHGIIVNALARELEKRGLSVGNDRKRDLYTVHNNRIDRIFEAKTDLSNGSIYSAVGQLLIYSAEKDLDGNQKILVLPERLKPGAERIMGKLGLKVLYYTFEREEVQFGDLDRFLI